MYEASMLRVHPHFATEVGSFATVTVVAGGRVERLHTSPIYDDPRIMVDWMKEMKRSLREARCLWCRDNDVALVREVEDEDGDGLVIVIGFCSEECYTEALAEVEAER